MPFVDKKKHKICTECRLHPDNDMFRDQEQHKTHLDFNDWKCGYCRKRSYEEKYLYQHFDNRHYDLLNVCNFVRSRIGWRGERNISCKVLADTALESSCSCLIPSRSKCMADLCGALHCDHLMDSVSQKSKCNPAAAARNKDMSEALADSCFPINEGASASHLHEFFLHQFCDAHTCSRKPKPFSRGRQVRTSWSIVISVLTILIVLFFYVFVYLYKRGMQTRPQNAEAPLEKWKKEKIFVE